MVSNSQSPKKPVKVEFVGIMPTLLMHCEHCMDVMHGTGMDPYSEQLQEYPAELVKEYFTLSEMAQKLRDEFHGAVVFDAIDAASPQGIWKTIRYRILRTPCVLIQGRKVFEGLPKYDELKQKITEGLAQP